MDVTLDQIKSAQNTIKDYIHRTDISPLEMPNGSSIYLKSECLQYTGSFKVRGAFNRILALSAGERRRGVIAASAGNHAQGVALAAKTMDIPARIVMPRFAPLQKITSTRQLGADVILHGHVFDDAYDKARELASSNDLTVIHAFDDPYVIAGQGTMGLEILQDVPIVDTVFVPIGGGGMASGICIAIKSLKPDVKIIGVEPQGAASMKASFEANRPIKLPAAATIADGVAVKSPGVLNYKICRRYLDDIITVDEDEIASAILYLMEEGKLVVEGAGAVAVAALLYGDYDTRRHTTVALVSGGNIDVSMLARIIDKGLLKAGRKVTFHTIIPDRPGQLTRALQTVSETDGNILNIVHERSRVNIELNEVRLEITMETRDRSHIHEIINKLEDKGYFVIEITE